MQLRFNKNRFKTVAAVCGVVFSSTLLTGCFLYAVGFRFNLTPSLPLGIWKIDKIFTPLEKGEYIWFTPTKEIADFAIQRGYLKENKNLPNNTISMLKQVRGLPGDTYSFKENDLYINDEPVENTTRRELDSKGRSMPQIEGGVVPEGRFFVLAIHPHSFDSRYFGTIPKQNVIGRAKPFITWTN